MTADAGNVRPDSDARVARYAEAIRTVVRGHHPRCFQVRPEGIPDYLSRDLCDCRVLWMLTASAEHERAEAAEAKLRAVEALADEWERHSRILLRVGTGVSTITHVDAVRRLRAVLDSHPTGTPDPTPNTGERGDDRERGLYGKYRVERISDPAGKHADCRYFVLDPKHDVIARDALATYAAVAANRGYHELSRDLWRWVDEYPVRDPAASSVDDKAGEGK